MQVRQQPASHPVAPLSLRKPDPYHPLSQALMKKVKASPVSDQFVSSPRGIHDG
jgi:hypothetical protein